MENKHGQQIKESIMNESIGYCECCGLMEHHRIEGLCPGCIKKAVNFNELKDDFPLGVEATDVSTIDDFKGVDHGS